MKIGKQIKALRKHKGLSQKELGDKCGICASYVSLIEKENANPTVDVLERIGLELGVSLPLLMFYSLEPEDLIGEGVDLYKFEIIKHSFRVLIDSTFV